MPAPLSCMAARSKQFSHFLGCYSRHTFTGYLSWACIHVYIGYLRHPLQAANHCLTSCTPPLPHQARSSCATQYLSHVMCTLAPISRPSSTQQPHACLLGSCWLDRLSALSEERSPPPPSTQRSTVVAGASWEVGHQQHALVWCESTLLQWATEVYGAGHCCMALLAASAALA